jgi:hypothetical protein
MDKRTLTPYGRDADGLRNSTRGTGVPAARRARATAKRALNVVAPLWDSAFHAERGCLSGASSPRHPAPPLHQ